MEKWNDINGKKIIFISWFLVLKLIKEYYTREEEFTLAMFNCFDWKLSVKLENLNC